MSRKSLRKICDEKGHVWSPMPDICNGDYCTRRGLAHVTPAPSKTSEQMEEV